MSNLDRYWLARLRMSYPQPLTITIKDLRDWAENSSFDLSFLVQHMTSEGKEREEISWKP
jgi:hypothetical protein